MPPLLLVVLLEARLTVAAAQASKYNSPERPTPPSEFHIGEMRVQNVQANLDIRLEWWHSAARGQERHRFFSARSLNPPGKIPGSNVYAIEKYSRYDRSPPVEFEAFGPVSLEPPCCVRSLLNTSALEPMYQLPVGATFSESHTCSSSSSSSSISSNSGGSGESEICDVWVGKRFGECQKYIVQRRNGVLHRFEEYLSPSCNGSWNQLTTLDDVQVQSKAWPAKDLALCSNCTGVLTKCTMKTLRSQALKSDDNHVPLHQSPPCCHFSYGTEHSYSSVQLGSGVKTHDTWYLNGDAIGSGRNVTAAEFLAMSVAQLRSHMRKYIESSYGRDLAGGFQTTNALILDIEAPFGLKLLGKLLSAERHNNSTLFADVVAALAQRATVVSEMFPHALVGFYGSPNAPDSYKGENYAQFSAGILEAARRGLFASTHFLLPVLYFGANVSSPSHTRQIEGWTNHSLDLALKTAVAAQRPTLPIFINTKFTYHNGAWLEPATIYRLNHLWRAVSTVRRVIYWFWPDDQLAQRGLPALQTIEAWWVAAGVVPSDCGFQQSLSRHKTDDDDTFAIKLVCDTEVELDQHLQYIRQICGQSNETFADEYNPIPDTCKSSVCARTIRRVAEDCSSLLAASTWFRTARTELKGAVAKCAFAPEPTALFTVLPADKATPITGCAGELYDGGGKHGHWNSVALLDAGPGRKVQLQFETVGLAPGDYVKLYDVYSADVHSVDAGFQLAHGKLVGKTTPREPFVSSGRHMSVVMITNTHTVGTGFSAKISCVCDDAEEWADAIGHGCTQYSKAHPHRYQTCSSASGKMPSGFLLSAQEACPHSCEACVSDQCNTWPCQNGGVCLEPEPSTSCATVAEFSAMASDVDSVCCNEPSESCAGGIPKSCNAGCAAVLVPMHAACTAGVLKAQATTFAATKKQLDAAVGLCSVTSHPHPQPRLNASCSCNVGYTGKHCEITPCHEGCGPGSCEVANGVGTCLCPDGYMLPHCTNPCQGFDCGNHGKCKVTAGKANCLCEAHYSGNHCETLDPCLNKKCSGHGTCAIVNKKPKCRCTGRYSGSDCQVNPKPCCSHGAAGSNGCGVGVSRHCGMNGAWKPENCVMCFKPGQACGFYSCGDCHQGPCTTCDRTC